MNVAEYKGWIDGISISSKNPVILWGEVRGFISSHKNVAAALNARERDMRACQSMGGYSDAHVFQYDETVGWRLWVEEYQF